MTGSFLLLTFWIYHTLFYGLQSVRWKICWKFNEDSLNDLLLSCTFQDLLCLGFLFFAFSGLIMMHLSVSLIASSYFEFTDSWDVHIHVFHQIWGVLAIISLNILLAPLYLSSPSETSTTYMFAHLTVSHSPTDPIGCLLQLNSFSFFLFLSLNNFYCPIFKLADSFYGLFKSAFEPV